jgi:hypothetical protein
MRYIPYRQRFRRRRERSRTWFTHQDRNRDPGWDLILWAVNRFRARAISRVCRRSLGIMLGQNRGRIDAQPELE